MTRPEFQSNTTTFESTSSVIAMQITWLFPMLEKLKSTITFGLPLTCPPCVPLLLIAYVVLTDDIAVAAACPAAFDMADVVPVPGAFV